MRYPNALPACLAIALCGLLSNSRAVDFDWNGAVDNDWLNAGNWTPAGPPSGGDGNFARFYNGTTRAANISVDVPVIQDLLTANNGTAGTRLVNQTGGTLSLNGWMRTGVDPDGAGPLGSGDAGTYTLSGGTLSASSFRLAEAAGSTSTINVSGGTFLQRTVADPANGDSWSRIGGDGVATVNLSGTGLISLDTRTMIGAGGSSAGTAINQTGGTFEVRHGELEIGETGTDARYNISAGTLRTTYFHQDGNFGGNITIGEWTNSNGRLTVSGTANVSAATNVIIGLGDAANPAKGTLEMSGGTFAFGGNGQLTTGANGALENRSFGAFFMSTAGTSQSTFNLSGGTFRQNDMTNVDDQGGWNQIGQNGPATFTLSGNGLASFDSRTHLGGGGTGNALVTQTGGTFEVRHHELIIADGGTAIYNISAGILQTARNINVGNWNNGNGNLNISGTGDVRVGQGMIIGQTENAANTSQGTVTMTGGRLEVQNDILMGNGNGSATTKGTFNLNGGTLDITGGNINKGSGVAVFNFNDGRLEGLGTWNIGDLLQTDGVLAVGLSTGAGTSTINGNYSLLAAGDIELSIFNATSFDALNVNGTVTLAGGLRITQDSLGLPLGTQFVLLNNDSTDPIVGSFAGFGQGQVYRSAIGNNYELNYGGGDGNDVAVRVVPEPTTSVLMFGAVGALGLLRRRRAA